MYGLTVRVVVFSIGVVAISVRHFASLIAFSYTDHYYDMCENIGSLLKLLLVKCGYKKNWKNIIQQ